MTTLVSPREQEIILGTILGDGHLAMLKSGARLEINHSEKQKAYVFWKHKELSKMIMAQPHQIKINDPRSNRSYLQWRFRSQINPIFTKFHGLFYQGCKKIVPQNILNILQSPLSLAVWFMDDGGRRNDSYGLFLNTLSFTKVEHVKLQECLRKNFSLDSRLHWIQDGYRLYIPSKDAQKFCKLVYPHLIPTMHYKLSYNPVTTSFARLDRARDRR
jgi:hypothetical protein